MKKRLVSCLLAAAVSVMQLLPSAAMIAYADDESESKSEYAAEPASPVSDASEAAAEKYEITDVIKSVSIGTESDVGTVLKPKIILKKGFDKSYLGEITCLWSTAEGTDTSVSMAKTYTVTEDDVNSKRELNVTIAASGCKGVIKSNSITAGKHNFTGKVQSASVTKTSGGFVIAAMEGYEYIISDTAAVPASAEWADLGSDVKITDKATDLTWYVFTRVKETDTTNASEPSAPVSVKISSDNSKLADLSLTNGVLNPSFNADITDYTAIIPYGVNVPYAAAEKQDQGAKVTIRQATNFTNDNKAVITVASENGASKTVYTVKFVEGSVLSSLSVNGTVINDFSPTKLNYIYPVSYADLLSDSSKTYTISASASHSASVTISENDFTLGSDNYGAAAKEITITVNSKNGVRVIYTVKFAAEACTHANRIEKISKEPTCTELGEKETVCSACGNRLGVENIPALGHDFDNGTAAAEPDCVNTGTVIYQCSRCGESLTRIIPALGHDWGEAAVDTEAACTADGVSSRHCTVCGAQGFVTLIPASGHSFGEWTKTDNTAYERTCDICGAKETKIAASTNHDHVFNGTVDITKPATCTDVGSQNVHCSVAGCTEFVTEETAKTAHDPNEAVIVNATCTAAGSGVVNCKICNTKISETEIPPAGHRFTNYTDTATCTRPGIKTAACDNGCGASDSIPTPAKGHSYIDWSKNSKGHWHECLVCGISASVISHTENGGAITTPATETTDGVKTYSCTECGYVIRTEAIPKIDAPNPTVPAEPTPSYPTTEYPENTAEKEPYIYGDASKTGWDAIISDITAADGDTVRVNINGTTELPQAVVSCIQNRNIKLELNMGNAVWTVNGFDVTEPKTVNMRVAERTNIIPDDVMESLYSELTAKQLRLYHSGSFGFTAKLALDVGKKYDGYYAALYYYNTETKQLEYSGQCYVSDGKAEFEFNHASYYAIGFSIEPIFDDVSANAGVVDLGTLVDVDSPVTNGIRIPQAEIPRGFKLSNKKRRYRILKKRRLDDLVFVL